MKKTVLIFLSIIVLCVQTAFAYKIISPNKPRLVDKTAITEFKKYISLTIKSELRLNGKPAIIHVGDTAFARSHGVDASKMAEESWIIKSVDQNLILAGGGHRGTLYATYHFLEDVLGIHWWNSFEEYIPSPKEINLTNLNLSGHPFFIQRDIYRCWGNLIPDHGRFSARNRLNRDGDQLISAEYGGSFNYGPPYFVHTFNHFFSEKEYFAKHPEYFSLIDNKRQAGMNSQLCLTNPDVLKIWIKKLKQYILDAEAVAKKSGVPAPLIYDISANDGFNACQCKNCRVIVKREESEAGPYLEFVNKVAREIKKFRPNLYISTLAYMLTETPPKNIRADDNVLVKMCDTGTNQALPLSAPENKRFLELLKAWGKISKNLGVWDYSIDYSAKTAPYPYEFTIGENLRILADHGVRFMFFEHEVPESADMHTMNVWLEAKLMENPYTDANKLIKTFITKYYGAAAPKIMAYRKLLRQSVIEKKSFIGWFTPPHLFSHIDLKTAIKAQKLFKDAKELVAGNETLLRRVRRSQMNLDQICNFRMRQLGAEHFANGGNEKTFPLDRKAMADNALKSRLETIDLIIPKTAWAHYQNIAKAECSVALSIPLQSNPPSYFVNRKIDYDFTAETAVLYGDNIVTAASDAESGCAVRHLVKDLHKDKLPLLCATYSPATKTTPVKRLINIKDILGSGYHWYKVGEITPGIEDYFFVLNDWTIQFPLKRVASESDGLSVYELYVSIKFTGPKFPHGKSNEPNAIYVERVVLLKSPKTNLKK